MGWFDFLQGPSRYTQQAAPAVATTPGASQTLGTAPEPAGMNSVGGRRRRGRKTGRKSRRSKKTAGRKSRR